jgi:hypothetical protein
VRPNPAATSLSSHPSHLLCAIFRFLSPCARSTGIAQCNLFVRLILVMLHRHGDENGHGPDSDEGELSKPELEV